MKKNADKGKSEGGNNMPKQRKTSSKNGEIETYLSSRYEFRYNTVLGRTERKEQPDTGYQLVPPSRSSITPSTQGNDYAETAWQRKLRNQANRKKKRRRGL